MTAKQSAAAWRVIGESVTGASHLRAGIPNQDSILQVRESATGLPLIVSVSDGHGSDKCFRSHRGSRLAVREAALLVGEFLDERRGSADAAAVEEEGREFLPRELVRRWRDAAEADLLARPFTREELDTLEEKDGGRARRLVEVENPLLAYGATSLTVAVEESFVLYLQLGDGDILNVSDSGEVTRALPADERLFANETTSLCAAGAEQEFRFSLQDTTRESPALILLSTDGYANSFTDEAGFLKVGSDLLEMLRADGFDTVDASLRGWLEEATHAGSGDDTTLGIICRMDAVRQSRAEEAGGLAASETDTGQESLAAAAGGGGEQACAHAEADAHAAPAAEPEEPAETSPDGPGR